MNDNEKDNETLSSNDDYSMKGLARLGGYTLTAFLVWCALYCPMPDTMQGWFFFWAVLVWLFC